MRHFVEFADTPQVVEARLKGAGMHWAREHVNPMVALRDLLCSDRQEEDWPQIATPLRADHLKERQHQQHARRTQGPAVVTAGANATPILPAHAQPPRPEPDKVTTMKRNALPPHKAKQPFRPPANHPWRRSPIGRARFKLYRSSPDPKM